MTLPDGGDLVPAAGYAAVLVPVDGSPLAETALGPAEDLARRFGAELHLVTAGVHHDERWWHEGYLARLAGRAGPVVGHVAAGGDVAAGIVGTARALAPALVCMATRGHARGAALYGSTFARVAATIGVPLVAVGPGTARAPGTGLGAGRLVVCLDGQTLSERSLPVAAGWARRLAVPVTLVTAADPLLARSRLGRRRAADTHHYPPLGDPEAYLDALASAPVLAGLDVGTRVLWGVAGPVALVGDELDREGGMVAIATSHARTGVARAALGSTTAGIVRRSPLPVLVVPRPRLPREPA